MNYCYYYHLKFESPLRGEYDSARAKYIKLNGDSKATFFLQLLAVQIYDNRPLVMDQNYDRAMIPLYSSVFMLSIFTSLSIIALTP